MADENQRITIHFADGNYVRTEIDADELKDEEEFLDFVMSKLREPGSPHWAEIGGVIFYTQTVCAIALDGHDEEEEAA